MCTAEQVESECERLDQFDDDYVNLTIEAARKEVSRPATCVKAGGLVWTAMQVILEIPLI